MTKHTDWCRGGVPACGLGEHRGWPYTIHTPDGPVVATRVLGRDGVERVDVVFRTRTPIAKVLTVLNAMARRLRAGTY